MPQSGNELTFANKGRYKKTGWATTDSFLGKSLETVKQPIVRRSTKRNFLLS